MNLPEIIKKNPVLSILALLAAGFATGWGVDYVIRGELINLRIELLKDKVSSLQKEIDKKDHVIAQKTNEVDVLTKKLRESENRENSHKASTKALEESLREKEREAAAQRNELQAKITSLETQLREARSQGDKRGEDSEKNIDQVKQGIIMTSHWKGKVNRVKRCFDASGIFAEPPKPWSVFVITKVKGNEYWPHPVELDVRDHTWKATGVCVDHSIEQRGDTITLIVCLVGESGKRLFDYYLKVAKQADRWIGIDEFPKDYVECQRVELVVSSKN